MSELSLGLIETVGLAAAFEAADTCVKSANVTLVGYELTKGAGMTVVKIEGNVGAVEAAIEAARMSAGKVNKVVSTKIIPRPSSQIDFMIKNSNTVGLEAEVTEKKERSEEIKETEKFEKFEKFENIEKIKEVKENKENKEIKEVEEVEEIIEPKGSHPIIETVTDGKTYTCNLCKDPKCLRQKGDLRNKCIHYKKQ